MYRSIFYFMIFFTTVSRNLFFCNSSHDRKGRSFLPQAVINKVVQAYLGRSTRRIVGTSQRFVIVFIKDAPIRATLLISSAFSITMNGVSLVCYMTFTFFNSFTRMGQFRFFYDSANRNITRLRGLISAKFNRQRGIYLRTKLTFVNHNICHRFNPTSVCPSGLPIRLRPMKWDFSQFSNHILNATLDLYYRTSRRRTRTGSSFLCRIYRILPDFFTHSLFQSFVFLLSSNFYFLVSSNFYLSDKET